VLYICRHVLNVIQSNGHKLSRQLSGTAHATCYQAPPAHAFSCPFSLLNCSTRYYTRLLDPHLTGVPSYLQVLAFCCGAADVRAGHPAEDGAHALVQLGHRRRRARPHLQWVRIRIWVWVLAPKVYTPGSALLPALPRAHHQSAPWLTWNQKRKTRKSDSLLPDTLFL
jgi:hypothetical protein